MTYGTKLINGFDEEVIGDFPVFYEVGRGSAIEVKDQNPNLNILKGLGTWRDALDSGTTKKWYYDGNSPLKSEPFQAASETATSYIYGGTSYDYPNPPLEQDALCFWEIPDSGILSIISGYMPYTDIGVGPFCLACPMPPDDGPMTFMWASTDASNLTTESTYGMMIRDAADEVIFDSRYPVVVIKDTIFISRADMEDIVKNNVAISFSLRTPIPSAKIHTALFRCHTWEDYSTGGNNYSLMLTAKIKQTGPSTIEVSRQQLEAQEWMGIDGSEFGEYFHNVFLFLA